MGCACLGVCLCGPRSLDAVGEGEGKEGRMPSLALLVARDAVHCVDEEAPFTASSAHSIAGRRRFPWPPGSEPRLSC